MKAYLIVTDNPFSAVTGEDGRYHLQNVPPGSYTIEAWHERLGSKSAQARVTAGRTTEVSFTMGDDSPPLVALVKGDRCTIATRGDNPVVRACREGGIKKAKAVMKSLQKAAKDKGLKAECDDCHRDESAGNWALRDDARARFKRLIEASSGP
jgi:hypothetical protein